MKKILLLSSIILLFACNENQHSEQTLQSEHESGNKIVPNNVGLISKENIKTIFMPIIMKNGYRDYGGTISQLNTQAQKLIEDGWKPVGGATAVSSTLVEGFCQTFYK